MWDDAAQLTHRGDIDASLADCFPNLAALCGLHINETHQSYGFGSVVVVVVSVFFVSAGGFTMVVFFSVFCVGGFTIVVLFSVFFSAGGLTVVVFCSHAPKSAAATRMQISFFIYLIGCLFNHPT